MVRNHMSRHRSGVHPCALIVVSVLLMLGHVCDLPIETLLTIGHAEAGEHDSHGDSVHTGSCEAVTPSDSAPPPTQRAASGALLFGLPVAAQTVARHVASPSAPSPSPPLFLLHAALLI